METNTTTSQFVKPTMTLTYRAYSKNTSTPGQWNEWCAYLDTLSPEQREEMKEIVSFKIQARQRLQDYKNSFRFRMKIRKYCNMRVGSDWYPFEVVRIVSDKCVEVRAMSSVQTVFPQEVYVGGFSAHTADNHNQNYEYSSAPENGIEKVRLGKKGWGNGNHVMMDRPYKFYDYNF